MCKYLLLEHFVYQKLIILGILIFILIMILGIFISVILIFIDVFNQNFIIIFICHLFVFYNFCCSKNIILIILKYYFVRSKLNIFLCFLLSFCTFLILSKNLSIYNLLLIKMKHISKKKVQTKTVMKFDIRKDKNF